MRKNNLLLFGFKIYKRLCLSFSYHLFRLRTTSFFFVVYLDACNKKEFS